MAKIPNRHTLTLFPRQSRDRTRINSSCAPQIIAVSLLLLGCFIPSAAGQVSLDKTGRLEGIVFVVNSDDLSNVPGAKVLVSGPVMAETETDADGKYAFDGMPPGTYDMEASFSELRAYQTINVEANQVTSAPLQLKPPEAKTTVNVAATGDRVEGPSPSETINDKIVRDAPNVSEQFESLLPLIPGVVRGPHGHINMKGARRTQSGAVVNCAHVTDPATGGPAIDLPIDVVSSVQVISNPYDPQYGKLTGAVSETDTGDSGTPVENITFTPLAYFNTNKNEIALWVADQWSLREQLTFSLGGRFDSDSITTSIHAAPRSGFLLVLTKDGKTLLKKDIGLFYDKVPLMLPVFQNYPDPTVFLLAPDGQLLSSTSYLNRITDGLCNPRRTSWNVALERQILPQFSVRVANGQRNTTNNVVVSPAAGTTSVIMVLSNTQRRRETLQNAGRVCRVQSTQPFQSTRDAQNDIASKQFGGFYNDAGREYRGELVFEF